MVRMGQANLSPRHGEDRDSRIRADTHRRTPRTGAATGDDRHAVDDRLVVDHRLLSSTSALKGH